ncbi:MAG: UDP-3-O-(3-hydroxymyristoyl)glucosamine N-acyltransferase, partial [Bacteroidia bacterium]
MDFTAAQIASLINGTVEGNAEATVNNVSKIEEGKPNTLTFLGNSKYENFIYTTDATVAIVNNDFKPEKELKPTLTLIRVENAYESFAKLLEVYNQVKNNKVGVEQPVFISNSAKYGEGCYIGAFTYVGDNVVIGENVKIYPNVFIGEGTTIGTNTILYAGVKIYPGTVIGKNCTIHAGTVLGSDGFGFAPSNSNEYSKVPQIGNVVLEDNVEIGANTAVDRATLGSTVIRKGAKLDNLIQIAHNVEIGENTVIAGQAAIAGSTKVGKNCMIGGQVGIVGHIKIADGVKIAAQSGVGASITNENEIVQGSPSFNIGEYRRSYVLFRSLPKMNDKLNELIK